MSSPHKRPAWVPPREQDRAAPRFDASDSRHLYLIKNALGPYRLEGETVLQAVRRLVGEIEGNRE